MQISTIRTWVRQLINDQEKTDGHNVFTYDSSNVFYLSEDFVDADSIVVYLNGTELVDTEWSHDADTNKVTIELTTSGDELEEDDTVEVSYNYFAKYSDTEIDGFIDCSLLYFTEFRYKKTFEISDTDVTALNDDDPTREEGHMIALVTAIHINPDNVDLRTPDITRSGAQTKSKKDQISDTIARWQRFVGKLFFLKDDCDCGC